jgi:hypothetical protein
MFNPLKTTLIPGLLVGLSTSIKGNVTYDKTETVERLTEGGALIAEWETEKTVIDPKEHELAVEIRAKARSIVGSVCASTAFGFLCPESERPALDKAFAEAKALCNEFNRTAKVTRIKFSAITGTIAPDDVTAIRAISSEVSTLLQDMKEGIAALDPELIRDAAKRATQLGNMLSPEAQERLGDGIKAARKLATEMKKAGEQVAIEIDATIIAKLDSARTSFLDLDGETDLQTPADTSGRVLDLAPHDAVTGPAAPVVDIDLEDMLR